MCVIDRVDSATMRFVSEGGGGECVALVIPSLCILVLLETAGDFWYLIV